MPKVDALARNRRREDLESADLRILDAAASLFREQGFAGTTTRDIARRAGILPGSLHYRYPTKASILLRLMREALRLSREAIEEVKAATVDPLERVRQALKAHLRLLADEGDVIHVLLQEWRSLPGCELHEMIQLRDNYEGLWNELLVGVAASQPLRQGVDLHLLRLFGFGAFNSVAQWYRPDGPLSAEAIGDAYFDFVLHGVLAPGHTDPAASSPPTLRNAGGPQ